MEAEHARDIQEKIEYILDVIGMKHIIGARIICMRSRCAKTNAYARIWSLPKIWQKALSINPFYVIEVVSERFDRLNDEEKTKVLIHELMHIPRRFSGGLVPHKHKGGKIGRKEVEEIYNEYNRRINRED